MSNYALQYCKNIKFYVVGVNARLLAAYSEALRVIKGISFLGTVAVTDFALPMLGTGLALMHPTFVQLMPFWAGLNGKIGP